jgi:hypothetical protein
VYNYAPDIGEWKILKKELLKTLHPDYRKFFSTRDQRTKALNFNDLEKEIVEEWKKIAGVDLYLEKL